MVPEKRPYHLLYPRGTENCWWCPRLGAHPTGVGLEDKENTRVLQQGEHSNLSQKVSDWIGRSNLPGISSRPRGWYQIRSTSRLSPSTCLHHVPRMSSFLASTLICHTGQQIYVNYGKRAWPSNGYKSTKLNSTMSSSRWHLHPWLASLIPKGRQNFSQMPPRPKVWDACCSKNTMKDESTWYSVEADLWHLLKKTGPHWSWKQVRSAKYPVDLKHYNMPDVQKAHVCAHRQSQKDDK